MSERPEVWLNYTRTYLEMTTTPKFAAPHAPLVHGLALMKAEDPPPRWFLHLYRSVGERHEWTDWLEAPAEDLAAFVGDPKVAIFTLMLQGWSGGFFVLDRREPGVCDLSYFGLTPEAQGRGLGAWLLKTAVLTAWEEKGVEKMTVDTCTLDDPRALPLYQKVGFVPVAQEQDRRRKTWFGETP
ncbi:MAG: GNAT family N-acetyltransferase [Pseudomonadota bacterium]